MLSDTMIAGGRREVLRQRALRALLAAGLAVITFVLLAFFGGFVYISAASTVATAQYQYGSDTAVLGTSATPPACLNLLRTPCATAPIRTADVALAGAFRLTPDFSYEPMLVEGVDVQSPKKKQPTFALTYHIRPEAVWSDDVPVSADDFIFTYETIVDPGNNIADRRGYDRISQAIEIDAKTVRFVFAEPYGAWRTLFPIVLPKHVLEGHDFDQVWANEIADPDTHEPIGSGPFLVTGAQPGRTALSRNPNWWGAQTPALEAVVFRFADPNTLVQEFHQGNVDVLYGPPITGFEQLLGHPGLAIESNPGPPMEHLDFNLDSATMPLLAQEWFRRAVAHSIDRDALAGGASAALPDLEALQNLLYLEQNPEFKRHFDTYDYSPSTVAGLMLDHGCTHGQDGIWTCGSTRARIEFATTTGNARRAAAQAQMIDQAGAAGIELVADNSPPGELFGTRLPARDYEMMMFAWVEDDDPVGWDFVYTCDGSQNFKGYCSPAFDDLLTRSESEVSPSRRGTLVNEADAVLATDVPSIPLFQIPTFLGSRAAMHGVVDNVVEGPAWNVEEWTKD